jgi:hypothetical protein
MAISRRGRRSGLVLAIILLLTVPAAAQQASEAQRNAIRQACPADYQSHCANVPAAGQAAFACLQRNLASLSPACQSAVREVSTRTPRQGASSSNTTSAPVATQSLQAAQPQSTAPMPPRE